MQSNKNELCFKKRTFKETNSYFFLKKHITTKITNKNCVHNTFNLRAL